MEEKSRNKFLTVPNILTIIRIMLTPLIFLCLCKNTLGYNQISLVFISGALITDFFDGIIARRFHQESKLGKILDPIADKLLINGIVIILALTRDFPVWFAITILARDLLILFLGSIMAFGKIKYIPQSNIWGKAALGFISLYILSYLLPWKFWDSINIVLVIGGVLFIFISGIIYFIRFIKAVTKDQ